VSWLVAHLEVLLGVTLASFAVLLILQQRRSPQSTAAWILLIFVLPYLALPMFIVLAVRKPPRVRRLEFADADSTAPQGTGMARFFESYGMPRAESGNRFRLVTTGSDAFATVRRLILEARSNIDAQFYIVAHDAVGQAFVELLEARARDGLSVRLIIDSFGGISQPRAALRRFRKAGGIIEYSASFLGIPGQGRLNLRNHRKTLVIDGQRAFGGGMNIGCDYMGLDEHAPARWVDLAFELEGPAVGPYVEIVTSDMIAAGAMAEEDPRPPSEPTGPGGDSGAAKVQPVPSGPDVRGDPLHDGIVALLHRAETRAWLVTPYFLPTDQLFQAMISAAQRRLDVRLMVPAKSNQKLADLARGSFLRGFAEAGGKVFRFTDGMIHAKAGVIDGIGWVGSANLDIRSMYLNYEAVAFLHDTGTVGALEAWMADRFLECAEGLPETGMARRIAEGAFRLAAPVL
jgi:cardiolipin synthase A/B